MVKTRLQMQGGKEVYKSFGFGLKKIYREEGLAALYRGYLPRMVVVVNYPSLLLCRSISPLAGPALRHHTARFRDAEEIHDPQRDAVAGEQDCRRIARTLEERINK